MDPSWLDDLFGAFAASRRRAVCRYFESSGDDAADLDELVEFVVGEERGARMDDRSEHREEVAVELHHVHLPRLAAVGLVEYDHRVGSVQYRGDPSASAIVAELCGGDVLCA